MSMGTPEVTDLRGSSRTRVPVPGVVSVSRDGDHRFSKPVGPEIRLLAGLGVEGDAHAGVTVQHRSRVASDPAQPNLRQVHLISAELLDEFAALGFAVAPGQLGENVTTRGLDLLALPRGAVLRLGAEARVEVTGLRNPCHQIDGFRPGLLKQVVGRAADGSLVRKAGVMGIVLSGGTVRPGDPIAVDLPPLPHESLDRV
jgi:MOSC domain-containing protein YiiM